MKDAFRISAAMLAIMTLLTGLLYPLVVTGIAQALLPSRANGSLIFRDGKPVGSVLIGQPFAGPQYFWTRLSATTPAPYNAASSSGSNLGPLNPAMKEKVQARIDELRRADPTIKGIPADLVTASGSGLDPHISSEAAEAQVSRVAKARRKSEDEIRRLVVRYTEGRQFGLLGEPRVNVLRLNLALDFGDPEPAAGTGPVAWKIPLPTRHSSPARPKPDRHRTMLNLWEILGRTHRSFDRGLTRQSGQKPSSMNHTILTSQNHVPQA